MRRLILLVLISLFHSGSASAGPCEGDIPSKSSGGTWCSNGDTGTIASDVTLTRDKQFTLVPSDNTTITNYGNILNDTNKTINTEAQYGGDNFTFTGASQITAIDGNIISSAPTNKEHISVIEIDENKANNKNINEFNHLIY